MKTCRSKDFLSITALREAFHLPLSEQAHAEVRQMQSDLATITLSDEADVWIYACGSDQFTAHRYYTFYFRDVRAHEAFGWIWKSRSTMKIKVFGWLLLTDRLNTRNMLKRRHYNIGEDHNCILVDCKLRKPWSIYSSNANSALNVGQVWDSPGHKECHAFRMWLWPNSTGIDLYSWRCSCLRHGACGRNATINTSGGLSQQNFLG